MRYPGWMLGCKKGLKVQAQFYIMDTWDTIYMISCIIQTAREYLPPNESFNLWLLEPEHMSHATLYVISQYDLDETGNHGPRISHDALLLLAYNVERETIFARSVYPITVRKLEEGKYPPQLRESSKNFLANVEPCKRRLGPWCSSPQNEFRDDVIDVMGCSAVTKDHPWCID